MTSHPWADFEIGLVTIELQTAFIVAASEGDNLFDSVFVTDANGLPCIPGESLAGVLRHALAEGGDPDEHAVCREVFGWQHNDAGESSRVKVSFAHVHDSNDQPVSFRGAATADPVLAFLASGVSRDHVRIGAHGAVDGRGKFDELVVPSGARFTFELAVSSRSPRRVHDLVALLNRPDVRIGRGSRRGLGRLAVVRLKTGSFDLHKPEAIDRLGRLGVALEKACRSDVLKAVPVPSSPPGEHWVHGTLTLSPIGTWMIGGGLPTGREPDRAKEGPWDRVPMTERRIHWDIQSGKDRGKVASADQASFLVPGSSVKGALRHRTGFHSRRLLGDWLQSSHAEAPACRDEMQLFGETRIGDTGGGGAEGAAGRVHISDAFVDKAPYVGLQHVSLDRFTQGPMDHLLYDEVALGECQLKLDVSVRTDELPKSALQALGAALQDLCEGRLAIGAGRGHGRFLGAITWENGKELCREVANVGSR